MGLDVDHPGGDGQRRIGWRLVDDDVDKRLVDEGRVRDELLGLDFDQLRLALAIGGHQPCLHLGHRVPGPSL
jgi:hypothetical protein